MYSVGETVKAWCGTELITAQISEIKSLMGAFDLISLKCPQSGLHLGSVFGFDYLLKIQDEEKN